jgi:hypothetical protein
VLSICLYSLFTYRTVDICNEHGDVSSTLFKRGSFFDIPATIRRHKIWEEIILHFTGSFMHCNTATRATLDCNIETRYSQQQTKSHTVRCIDSNRRHSFSSLSLSHAHSFKLTQDKTRNRFYKYCTVIDDKQASETATATATATATKQIKTSKQL